MSVPTAPTAPAAPAFPNELVDVLKGISDGQKALNDRLAQVGQGNAQARAGDGLATAGPFDGRAPHARTGESILTSRGYHFSRVIGVMTGKLDKSQAKVEAELSSRLQKEYVERGFYTKTEANSIMVPLSSELMLNSGEGMEKLASEVGEVVKAGVAGANPDEMRHIVHRAYGRTKALAWDDESGMGALVGPPQLGEPIEILRNKEVFLKAGARTVPFPPSGRIVWPRFTGVSTAYWVGSSTQNRFVTDTGANLTTGDVVLQAKKLGVLVTIPNELFRFPTVSVEQVVRDDMMKQAALRMDKSFLDATGSALEPKGIINYSNINKFTAGTTGNDGDTLEPEDVAKIIGTIEEQNIEFGAWIMRPLMYAAISNRRADAVTAGDKKGMFLFNVLRNFSEQYVDVRNNETGNLEGYPVFKSNQIVNTRSKGASSNLSYILFGNFEQYLIAMSGVMEFMVATQGDTIFPQDQSQIRLITWADGAPRYEEAFGIVDSLVVG